LSAKLGSTNLGWPITVVSLTDAKSDGEEGLMYTKPTIKKFGSFRDLTKVGFANQTDGGTAFGTAIGNNCQWVVIGNNTTTLQCILTGRSS
jgi:hypothetical protein